MKVKYILPIESIRGSIGPDYYARVLNGQMIIQRRPNRKKHKPTAAERANQMRFAKTCPGTSWRRFYSATTRRSLGDHHLTSQ